MERIVCCKARDSRGWPNRVVSREYVEIFDVAGVNDLAQIPTAQH